MIEFFVPQEPRGKGSVRAGLAGGRVRTYQDDKSRAYEAQAALFAREAMSGRPPIDRPVCVDLVAHMGIPASWSARKRAAALAGSAAPTRRPDCSNVAKAIEDSMNGIVWRDDALVVDLVVRKRYGETPGVQVRVREWVPA